MKLSVILIQIIHFIIVILVVLSIFVDNCLWKQLALTLLLFLLVQHMLGYEKCGLTEIEHHLLGNDKYQEGFLYRLINPMIKIREKSFYKGKVYIHILYVLILVYQIRNC